MSIYKVYMDKDSIRFTTLETVGPFLYRLPSSTESELKRLIATDMIAARKFVKKNKIGL